MRLPKSMRFDSKNREKKKKLKACAKHLATHRPTRPSGTKTSANGKTAARPLPTKESAVKTYDVILTEMNAGKQDWLRAGGAGTFESMTFLVARRGLLKLDNTLCMTNRDPKIKVLSGQVVACA